ncbi:alkaline serine protease [Paenibacillus sp. FSL R5-0490]|uniref:S8 family peptidase n=1 Tax=Paenibacillus sp. FSL R5-0490 TaxID=1920424 RepID=UPI0009700436|nr:S8 family peptidase [Paenibacillus sp. FSL R5-0490]OMF61523.1 alkaline serine protease [Paenibacillus sp. FSL R5-0490]
MERWLKKSINLAAGIGIAAGSLLGASGVSAESGKEVPGISAVQIDQPSLQKKLEQSKESALSGDTLVVKFKKPLTQSQHKMAGGTLIKQFSNLNYAVVKVRNKNQFSKVLTNYKKLNGVISAYPSVNYKPLSLPDPKAKEQYQNELLQLEKAQKLAGKNPVTVAVIDQGVDMNHPDLKGKLLPSYNAVNPMSPGTPDYHGTHVAGIVAANKNNGIGGYGVNPNAKILPIDVFDRGWGASDYVIAQGILYAVEKGAKVINMSLGGPMKSPLIEEALKKAAEKNVVVVAAAGNTGDDSLSYPAAYEGVISVGNINSSKKLGILSTCGTSVDIVAPGEDVYSTMYDYEKKSSFLKMSGTSMASPMAAGAASLLLSKHPGLTPIQIEYILEHTAEDLGDKGFDVVYGNGLLNPAAAMQYDIKKLPALTKHQLSEKEILEKAEAVSLEKKQTVKGAITAPFQEKWYKTDVEKGDLVQFVLNGAKQFDYKLKLFLVSDEGKVELDVNKVREGYEEGKLFEVPFSGTLAFGVKDVNGSFDDSGRGQSKFSLSAEKASGIEEDGNSIHNMSSIELPYSYGKELLTGKDGDDDFYQFTVKEEQAVKIDLAKLPGVDTSISVYMGDQIFPPDMEEITEEEKEALLEEMFYGKYPIEPAFYANRGGKSEGETLSFTAMPEMPYIIKISNKIDQYFFGMYDFMLNFDLLEEEQTPEPSLIPYKLQVNGKTLPADEDIFPYMMDEEAAEKEMAGNGLEKQRSAFEDLEEETEEASEEEAETEPDFTEILKEGAQPFKMDEKGEGYIQTLEDEDWFSVVPDETGIYEFKFDDKKGQVPLMEIYRIKEETDVEGNTYAFLEQIGTNMQFDWVSMKLDASMLTGLKAGESYYIKAGADYYTGSTSFDPYIFSAKMVIKDPQDPYEDNDSLEKIKNLPSAKIEGNLAMPFDQDVFYLESKTANIYGVSMKRKNADAKWKAKYPKELLSPFYGIVVIAEDVNKNRKLDPEEFDRIQYIEKGIDSGATYGSFKAEKNKNYIIIASGYFDGNTPLSLLPYELAVAPVNQNDEDKGSVVKNNKPSKPLMMKKSGSKLLTASGHLNAGVPNGDEDWYELKIDKQTKGYIEFNAGTEIDGVVTLYKDGKLLAKADYYSEGDGEVLYFNLKKGVYHIKVRDTFGGSTLDSYSLKVNLQ